MLKKIAPWAGLLVLLVYVSRNPGGAAGAGRHLGAALASAADSLAQFFVGLIGHP